MSVLHSAMYSNQLHSPFAAGARHSRTSSLSEILAQIKPQIAARKMRSASPAAYQVPEQQISRKRRSHSDETNAYANSPKSPELPALKRPRTAPSSPTDSKFSLENHSPAEKVTLPSISDALAGVSHHVPKTSAPTVSLDYFDTYKPNDANWRYGLIDSIRHTKPPFSLEKYAYLDKHAKTLPSIHELEKPRFDSRISKTLPTLPARKINFPYESNYTYLNKTYLHDVEKFPEYLELAQSLVQLSQREPVLENAKSGQNDYFSSNQVHTESSSHQQAPPSPQYVSYRSDSYQHVLSPSHNKHSAAFTTPEQSFERPHAELATRFIPITPPSVKDKTRSELMRSPPRAPGVPRVCISCGSDQSPCWRPSWSTKEGQLCNSCGLRYKKTAARCLNMECKKIPAKGEWALMQSKGKSTFEDGERAYACLSCGCKVEVK
ncbi:hypothetical protein OXX80_004850 [Metschnikowia pulcherrima]